MRNKWSRVAPWGILYSASLLSFNGQMRSRYPQKRVRSRKKSKSQVTEGGVECQGKKSAVQMWQGIQVTGTRGSCVHSLAMGVDKLNEGNVDSRRQKLGCGGLTHRWGVWVSEE